MRPLRLTRFEIPAGESGSPVGEAIAMAGENGPAGPHALEDPYGAESPTPTSWICSPATSKVRATSNV